MFLVAILECQCLDSPMSPVEVYVDRLQETAMSFFIDQKCLISHIKINERMISKQRVNSALE